MPDSTKKIFVSVTHTLTLKQEDFLIGLEKLILSQGYQPVTVGRVEKSNNAVEAITDTVSQTNGTIIVALKKMIVVEAKEYPDSNQPISFFNRYYSSIWNQIEGAMTLQVHHPLLILCEQEIYHEGIFMPSFYPTVNFVLDHNVLNISNELSDQICSWIKNITNHP